MAKPKGIQNDQNNSSGKHCSCKPKSHATFNGSAPEVVKEKEIDLLDAAGDLADDIRGTLIDQAGKAITAIGDGVS